jgi:hypothetical protein
MAEEHHPHPRKEGYDVNRFTLENGLHSFDGSSLDMTKALSLVMNYPHE